MTYIYINRIQQTSNVILNLFLHWMETTIRDLQLLNMKRKQGHNFDKHITLLFPRLRDQHRRGRRKTVRARGDRWLKETVFQMQPVRQIWTHSNCNSIYMTSACSGWTKSHHEGWDVAMKYHLWLGSYCQLISSEKDKADFHFVTPKRQLKLLFLPLCFTMGLPNSWGEDKTRNKLEN